MKTNMYEIIAEVITEELIEHSHQHFNSMRKMSWEVRLQTFRRIIGTMYQMKNANEERILFRNDDIHQVVSLEFLQNIDCFRTILNMLENDEELHGELPHIIGTFTLDVFIPVMCEFEDITLEDEIEIIAQVFMLLHIFFDEDILQSVENASLLYYDENDIITCNSMSKDILNILMGLQESMNREKDYFHTKHSHYQDHKDYIVEAIMHYQEDGNYENEAFRIQSLALFIAIYSEEVDCIKDRGISEFNISFQLGILYTDKYEEIFALCKEIIETPYHHQDAALQIIRHVNNYLENEGTLPSMETIKKYVMHIYDIFQMLRIMCVIRQREDIIHDLKYVFSTNERYLFEQFIHKLNMSTKSGIEVE